MSIQWVSTHCTNVILICSIYFNWAQANIFMKQTFPLPYGSSLQWQWHIHISNLVSSNKAKQEWAGQKRQGKYIRCCACALEGDWVRVAMHLHGSAGNMLVVAVLVPCWWRGAGVGYAKTPEHNLDGLQGGGSRCLVPLPSWWHVRSLNCNQDRILPFKLHHSSYSDSSVLLLDWSPIHTLVASQAYHRRVGRLSM